MYTGMSVVLDNSRLHDPVTQAHPERGVVGGDESVAVNVDGRLTAASTVGVLHGPVGIWDKAQPCSSRKQQKAYERYLLLDGEAANS